MLLLATFTKKEIKIMKKRKIFYLSICLLLYSDFLLLLLFLVIPLSFCVLRIKVERQNDEERERERKTEINIVLSSSLFLIKNKVTEQRVKKKIKKKNSNHCYF